LSSRISPRDLLIADLVSLAHLLSTEAGGGVGGEGIGKMFQDPQMFAKVRSFLRLLSSRELDLFFPSSPTLPPPRPDPPLSTSSVPPLLHPLLFPILHLPATISPSHSSPPTPKPLPSSPTLPSASSSSRCSPTPSSEPTLSRTLE